MKFQKTIGQLLQKDKTLKQKYNLLLAKLQFKTRSLYLRNYPVQLTIDPINICNMHCKLCPTGTGVQGRKRSIMSFDIFKKIIDECGAYLWVIDMYNWGEPLLNKDIFKMITYARERNIDVNISTNLNYFNDDMCISLINSGLNKLIISLDGASQESVENYQKGNDFQLVIKNIEKIVKCKELLKSKSPFIQWRFLVNKYNENEIEKAKLLAKRLKIDKLEIGMIRCSMGEELLLNKETQYENVKEYLPDNEELSMYDYSLKQKKNIGNICKLLWFVSAIQPDGSVSPCEAVWNERFDFGNINDSPFMKIWNSEKYQSARKISRGDKISENGHICYICTRNNSQI